MIHPAFAAPVAAAAVAAGWWINRRVLGWLPDDPPRPGRKQHQRPVPLAGITLLPAVLPWLLAEHRWWLAAAVATAAVTGFLDDRGKEHGRDLGWRIKAVLLLVAAALAAVPVADPVADPWQFAGAVVLAFVLANATNFLDNTDGVACSLSAASLLVLTQGHGPLGAAGYAALGFLGFNWPRAAVFLGDAGAYVLGLCVAAAVVPPLREDWRTLGAVAIPFVDFAQVIAARVLLGVAPWIGDRRHLTHIAQNLGLPPVAVAPVFAGLAILLAWAAHGL